MTATGFLGACGVTTDDAPSASTSASADASPSASSSEPGSVEPSPSPTATVTVTTTATPAPSPSPTPPAGPEGALLGAAELPRFNGTSPWTVRRTGPVSGTPFGLCQKFDVLTIGATRAVERTFTTDGDSAGQQVADFPDPKNALRASRVFEAWHRDCAARVRGAAAQVRPLTAVPVSSGQAWWYLASYRRGGQGHCHAFGLVLSGPRLTVLRMDHVGQDHDYPAGRDPLERAVRAAASRLG
jgi:hypothetical protein